MSDEITKEIVSPFESNKRYAEILEELRALRKDGEDKISAYRSENKDIKLNKQIDPDIKQEQIDANNKKIEEAKIVKQENAAKIKELIKEAEGISRADTKVHRKEVSAIEKVNIAEAKRIFNEEKLVAIKEHKERLQALADQFVVDKEERMNKRATRLADLEAKNLAPEEHKVELAKLEKHHKKYLKKLNEDHKISLDTENVRYKSKILEIKTIRDEAIDKAKTNIYNAYHDSYNYMGKARNGVHSIAEKLENSYRTFIYNFNIQDFLIKNGLYIIIFVFLLYCLIQSAVDGNSLLEKDHILAVLSQSSTKLFFSLGVAGLILLGGTDLSIGRMTGMAASFTCIFLGRAAYESDLGFTIDATGWATGGRIIVALMVAIALCVAFSSIAGYFTAKFKMHPFITTLSTQLVIFGIMMIMWQSIPAFNMNPDIKKGITGDSSINIIIFAVLAIMIMWFIWNKTKFGKNMYAVGGNQEAASVSGISVFKTTLLVFVMAGVLYGIGGFLEGARVGTANPSTGVGTELDAIAACVIGGISFSGGVGKIKGAVIGTLIFTCLTYFLTSLGFDTNTQYIFKGVIIMAAVCLDSLKYLKKK